MSLYVMRSQGHSNIVRVFLEASLVSPRTQRAALELAHLHGHHEVVARMKGKSLTPLYFHSFALRCTALHCFAEVHLLKGVHSGLVHSKSLQRSISEASRQD